MNGTPCLRKCRFINRRQIIALTDLRSLGLFRDGVNASRNGTDYIREIRTVEAGSSFGVEMAPGGGVAMRLKRK